MIVEITGAMLFTAGVGIVKVLEKLYEKFIDRREDRIEEKLVVIDTKLDKFSDTMLQVTLSLERHSLTLDRVVARMDADDQVDAIVEKFSALSLKTRS